MRLVSSIIKPFALAGIFTASAMILEQDPVSVPHGITAPVPSHSQSNTAYANACHDMLLNQLGLFKEYNITLSGGKSVLINQWMCGNEFNMRQFQKLSMESFPQFFPDLWAENGSPVLMTIKRSPL